MYFAEKCLRRSRREIWALSSNCRAKEFSGSDWRWDKTEMWRLLFRWKTIPKRCSHRLCDLMCNLWNWHLSVTATLNWKTYKKESGIGTFVERKARWLKMELWVLSWTLRKLMANKTLSEDLCTNREWLELIRFRSEQYDFVSKISLLK